MKPFPSIPRVETAPDVLEGHLWLLEKVDGANFRFQLRDTGLLRFGTRGKVYDDPAAVPEPYQHAVRHVREELDRTALRAAVEDVESIVFFGEAMHHHTIDYDWEQTPSFLGFDIWSAQDEAFRPPGAVQAIFERLGLQPVRAVQKELPARDFDPDSFAIPQSAYYDGPAEGVVIHNKRGGRAKLLHPEFQEVDETVPLDGDASDLAARYATDRRFEKWAAKLGDRGEPVTFEALYKRVLEDIVREEHKQIYHREDAVDLDVFREAVAERTRRFLDAER
jgi:hypothetical protein